MRRAPKKFTDASQSEITKEWQEWYAEAKEESLEELMSTVSHMGEPAENRWPEHFEKEVGDGCWILVVEEPATEMRSRFRIPTPSLWWARPEASRPGGFDLGSRALPKLVPGPYRVVIETPGGSLWLFPHEYVVCRDPLPLITDPEVTIHPLGGRPSLDEEKTEQMFYLQSRGVPYSDALLIIMDGVDMRDWGWVEFPEYVREVYEGVGARLRLANPTPLAPLGQSRLA